MKKRILFLRHPAPQIPAGFCYGQTDLEIAEPEKLSVRSSQFDLIFASPLQRCSKAADILFPERKIILDERLKELNFGEWENRKWDDLPKKDLEEPVVEQEKADLWGGTVTLGNGWVLGLPEMAADTRLPITVEARRLEGD